MEAFEELIQKAINQGVVANAVVEARHRDPSYTYSKTFGSLTLSAESSKIESDAVFWIVSCTKLLTSTAALQCVRRGLVTLDEPISRILPEFAHPDIITGFHSQREEPILIKAKNPITLRQLLTHTSGMVDGFSSPLVAKWLVQNPVGPPRRDIVKESLTPLAFEPGTLGQWRYGVGLEWVGKVVERLNGGINLGAYMDEHIFKPLGITSLTFRPLRRKDLMDRMCPGVKRQTDGKLKPEERAQFSVIEPVDDSGGHGLYGTAGDYVKVLESLLRDDGKLLDSSTADELFKPQLLDSEELQKTLNQTGPGSVMNGFGQTQLKLNYGLGGLVAVEGIPGSVGKGMLCWYGASSCFWWIDREKGTCGFYGSQIFSFGDKKTGALAGEFRKAVYNAA